jgi:Ni/Fe-hydrogenase 1 B-type cytochrome subunit
LEELTAEPFLFRHQKNSTAIRIWHWLTFIGFAASLTTVLLGSTMFRTRNNISFVTVSAAEKGAVLNSDQARSVAHAYSDKLWNTHRIIGIVLSFLLLSRVVIELFQRREEKILNRIHAALSLRPSGKQAIGERDHYVLVKRSYLIFYILFLIMATTGLIMAFEEQTFLKPIQHSANSVHRFFQYGIYAYILLHLTGVIRADMYRHKGIVSGMINGGN